MKRKQPPPDDVIRLRNCVAKVVPGFTIVDLSEQDIRDLHAGKVPSWIHDTAEWWLRDNPKPSDVPPKDSREQPEAVSEVA